MKTISAAVLFNNNWRIRNTGQRQAYFIVFRIKCSFLDARSPLCFLVCVRFQVTKTGKKKPSETRKALHFSHRAYCRIHFWGLTMARLVWWPQCSTLFTILIHRKGLVFWEYRGHSYSSPVMKVATQKGYIRNEWLQGAVAGTNSLLVSELSKIYLRGPKFVSCEWSSLDLRGRHSQRTCASAFEPCVRIFPVPIRCKYPHSYLAGRARFSCQTFPKRTHIPQIPSKPCYMHSNQSVE